MRSFSPRQTRPPTPPTPQRTLHPPSSNNNNVGAYTFFLFCGCRQIQDTENLRLPSSPPRRKLPMYSAVLPQHIKQKWLFFLCPTQNKVQYIYVCSSMIVWNRALNGEEERRIYRQDHSSIHNQPCRVHAHERTQARKHTHAHTLLAVRSRADLQQKFQKK